jgi:oxygen-independent coproporphyrinogen-3 oxidase
VCAIGVGAWSYEPPSAAAPNGLRRGNLRSLERYLERIVAGEPADAEPPERLTAASARGEAAFLALRTAKGLDAAAFRAEFGAAPRAFWPTAIDELVGAGLLREAPGGTLTLTPRGILLSNSVFAHFV